VQTISLLNCLAWHSADRVLLLTASWSNLRLALAHQPKTLPDAGFLTDSDLPGYMLFPRISCWSTTMNPQTPESFVDADEAAKFLSLTRRRILELARAGRLPGHPIGDGVRRIWRFRLSELAAAIVSTQKSGFASRERAGMVQPIAVPGRSEN
jgi:excisionase family DNA binding protein